MARPNPRCSQSSAVFTGTTLASWSWPTRARQPASRGERGHGDHRGCWLNPDDRRARRARRGEASREPAAETRWDGGWVPGVVRPPSSVDAVVPRPERGLGSAPDTDLRMEAQDVGPRSTRGNTRWTTAPAGADEDLGGTRLRGGGHGHRGHVAQGLADRRDRVVGERGPQRIVVVDTVPLREGMSQLEGNGQLTARPARPTLEPRDRRPGVITRSDRV